MQRKPPAKRAFTGLAGRPYDPGVMTAKERKQEQRAREEHEKTAPDPLPRGGLTGLASLSPRAHRDPSTGKVIEAQEVPLVEAEVLRLRAVWRHALHSAGVNLYVKCVHGHMYADSYCDVCRLSPIDPDYNPDVYRIEITKALRGAKKSLIGEEGRKDLHDLNQIVDIEIWKASKKYGEEMNQKLAYTIAKNQAGKYITKRIEQQTVESTDAEGNVIRIPRFVSMDNKPLDDNGNEMTTAVEIEVVNSTAQGTDFNPIQIERLQGLVATWYGQKRLVGEAMLRPGFNVRNVPGVSKSSVARIRQAVLKDFKSCL